MKKHTLGMMISSLRKAKGMTQLELAEKMGSLIRLFQNGKEIYPIQILILFLN